MKILLVHSGAKKVNASPIDMWRIWRPFRELKKHVDWQIDEAEAFVPEVGRFKDKDNFTEEELENAAKQLGQYDIVWSSYYLSPITYALCMQVADKYGTKFVLDIDDDIYNISEDNVGWWSKVSQEQTKLLQYMYDDAPYVVTSTETLATLLRAKRAAVPEQFNKKFKPSSVHVVPNYISKDYKHKPFDNGEKIVIGFFGGASHYNDLHETGFIEGLVKLMHENKNVYFKSCGMPVDKYVPKARYEYIEGKKGHAWVKGLFPTLNFDIAVGPLVDTVFARSKSNIKWQESTLMGAAFVCSSVGPYQTIRHGMNAHQVKNTPEAWYEGLKKVVEDVEYREVLQKNSKDYIEANMLMENNWQQLKTVVERIYDARKRS